MTTRTALVTGGTGFIGRHLVAELTRQGWQSVVLVRSAGRASVLPRDPAVVPVGVTDLVMTFTEHRPDVVFHLASHFVARHTGPAEVSKMVAANVGFGSEVAEAAAETGTPIVSASTVWQHYQGSDYDPVSLYAATKQALDVILRYYSEVAGLGWTSLVLGDTYGPGDDRGKLLSHLLRAAATGGRFQAASGEQLWEAVHVRDVVRAFVEAGHEVMAGSGSRRYQLRPTSSTNLRDVVAAVEQATGRSLNVQWGAWPDRGREMLWPWVVAPPPPGWQPRIGLVSGIREIWDSEFLTRP